MKNASRENLRVQVPRVQFVMKFVLRFLIAASLFQAAVATAVGPPVLSVYFPDYRYKEGVVPNFRGTTHLVLFSSKPNEDGSVDFSRISPEMIAMGAAAKKISPKLKVTFCVGGWGRGKLFANAVSTEENRNRFVKSLTDFCEENALDGVDIDWEFPKGDQEHADLNSFLQRLSEKLHTTNRILTIALGYTRPLSAEAYACIDHVNLMSYQPWNPQPYEAWLEKAVTDFLESGLPPEKLILGLPFFTKELGGKRRAIQWTKLAGKGESTIPESDHEFSPVGKAACDLRLDLMKKYKLGGVMVWEFGQDSPNEKHSLMKHLSEKLATP